MSKTDIIKKLKEKHPELSQSELEKVLETFSISVEKTLKNGQMVQIRDFGTFFIKKLKEKYSSRNPKTGELIYVPEKNKVRFKPIKKLKDFPINEKTKNIYCFRYNKFNKS